MVEREIVRDRPTTDREVVVDERPPPGGGGAGIVAAIIGIILVLLLGWFLLRMAGVIGEAADDGAVDPTQIEGEIDINDNTGGGGTDEGGSGGDAEAGTDG